MKKILKTVLGGGVLVLGLWGSFLFSKSRSWQFFGGIIRRVSTEERVVALTFDDAPRGALEEVLAVLNEKRVKATFFAVGAGLAENPEAGKRIVGEGHELGNHSYSHQHFLLKPGEFIRAEIEETNRLIREAGQEGEIFFRPPYGKKFVDLPWYLFNRGIRTVTWDVEPETELMGLAEGEEKARRLTERVLAQVKPGSIILLHPFCENCGSARAALGPMIDGLESEGYRVMTVGELLKVR